MGDTDVEDEPVCVCTVDADVEDELDQACIIPGVEDLDIV